MHWWTVKAVTDGTYICGRSKMAQGDDDGEFMYCTCFTAYSEDKNMVCCDICNKGYHFECVGYANSVPNRDFICGACPQ